MIRHISPIFLAFAVRSTPAHAQPRPDFSGVWTLDPARSDDRSYGQIGVITQTAEHVDMAVLHFATGQTSIISWELLFDRWRPRRGGDRSLEPVVQSRWNGPSLNHREGAGHVLFGPAMRSFRCVPRRFDVTRRTRDIGIRLALGAGRASRIDPMLALRVE
jgi:hypothetical protein